MQGDQVRKSVFIIFFQGDQLKNRVKKICEGYAKVESNSKNIYEVALASSYLFVLPLCSGLEQPCTHVQKHPRRGKRCKQESIHESTICKW